MDHPPYIQKDLGLYNEYHRIKCKVGPRSKQVSDKEQILRLLERAGVKDSSFQIQVMIIRDNLHFRIFLWSQDLHYTYQDLLVLDLFVDLSKFKISKKKVFDKNKWWTFLD